MANSSSRREFFIQLSSVSAVLASGGALSACGGSDSSTPAPSPAPAPTPIAFNYGVASGDPLTDSVILWTHAKPQSGNQAVELTYEVASTADFSSIISSGKVSATEAASYTAKVDAKGLAAGTEYFYRFRAAGAISAVGRTRTLPAANASSVKFAMVWTPPPSQTASLLSK
jgi:alkaline phosphatase D